MLPVHAALAVMCHVLFTRCMHVHESGCRSDYCMFSRSIDTPSTSQDFYSPVMWMVMSLCELHDARSSVIVQYESVMNRSPPHATICCGVFHCVVELFDCFSASSRESFQRRSGRPTTRLEKKLDGNQPREQPAFFAQALYDKPHPCHKPN